MITKTIKPCALLAFCLLATMGTAQVGIGTTAPNGILDINSNTFGVVYPVVALTATDIQAPVTNPNSGNLVAGTTVYNTNSTNSGTESVYPGTYMWNGTDWIPQFSKRQSEIFFQSGVLRSSSTGGYENVPGLGAAANKSFTAKYTGFYRIEVRVNYGGGTIEEPGSGDGEVNTAYQDGTFRFVLENHPDQSLDIKSISTYNNLFNAHYNGVWKETYFVAYQNLNAGQTYDFNLTFDQSDSPGFENNGNSGVGRGYVGKDIPCSVEFTYVEDYHPPQ